ncbi:hypothetical protein QGM71_05330 [Virgibacillus sp. C22-A2]|uniref:Uncharacterized protein n=1 Tax=Virgibacillus tibetensis TaxID=3042313 RepID=A0ABU6KDN8_9BACI|nr:hypothetical protein [Virgibacillus sp. C22-A2]
MTKEMMEDLLQAITLLLEELKDLQTSSHQIDELYSNLETEADNVELHIHGLQQNVRILDKKLAMVIEGNLAKGTKKLIAQRIN